MKCPECESNNLEHDEENEGYDCLDCGGFFTESEVEDHNA